MKKYLLITLFFSITLLGQTKFKKKNINLDHSKLAFHEPKKKVIGNEKTSCPVKVDRKNTDLKSLANTSLVSNAYFRRSTSSVHFDVVQLEDIHLDIPAFKQFRNNMTDFTADGEHEFHTIIEKIAVFLGTNHEGKGVGLKIIGSASQIPTSYDFDLPNNNINSDGSSKIGKTSIKNNIKLAKARADELAKKIKEVFPSIEISTPKIEEISIGKTEWTKEVQMALNKAVLKKDKNAIRKVYEPFQKDQWVKVESKERTKKSVKPESLKMYMISTSPSLKTFVNDKEVSIKSVFIVSKKTYDFIGDDLSFSTVEARNNFIKTNNLEIASETKKGLTRWYLLNGKEEKAAFNTPDSFQKVLNMFHVDIIDALDEEILEKKIRSDLQSIQQ